MIKCKHWILSLYTVFSISHVFEICEKKRGISLLLETLCSLCTVWVSAQLYRQGYKKKVQNGGVRARVINFYDLWELIKTKYIFDVVWNGHLLYVFYKNKLYRNVRLQKKNAFLQSFKANKNEIWYIVYHIKTSWNWYIVLFFKNVKILKLFIQLLIFKSLNSEVKPSSLDDDTDEFLPT